MEDDGVMDSDKERLHRGVEVHKHPNGQKYILASDRDSGIWIFQYTGP